MPVATKAGSSSRRRARPPRTWPRSAAWPAGRRPGRRPRRPDAVTAPGAGGERDQAHPRRPGPADDLRLRHAASRRGNGARRRSATKAADSRPGSASKVEHAGAGGYRLGRRGRAVAQRGTTGRTGRGAESADQGRHPGARPTAASSGCAPPPGRCRSRRCTPGTHPGRHAGPGRRATATRRDVSPELPAAARVALAVEAAPPRAGLGLQQADAAAPASALRCCRS